MAVLWDWFAAASDGEAASTIDRRGGPGSAVPEKRGLFGRVKSPYLPAYPVVGAVDPVVQGATLEELLTGRPFDEITLDPRSGSLMATRDEGEVLVIGIADSLRDALASADRQRLLQVAGPWSETEEFRGQADPDGLVPMLIALSALAAQARHDGASLYCWVSL